MDELKYFSTRGGDERLTFEEAVLTGLAPNGGLYIPTRIPTLPENWQSLWAPLSFPELSLQILSLFIPPSSIPSVDLVSIITASYSTFRHPLTTPLKQVGEREYVLELWHGPTFAFKDVALQFLGNVFEYCLKKKNKGLKDGEARNRLTVVGATSGDTGGAAIYGLRGKEDISIFILYPHGRVSPIQERQMATVPDENVHCVAVDGTFDDCQDIVKSLFSDPTFNATHHLGAVNSINWARILAQIVYYFHSYLQLPQSFRDQPGNNIQFVVPTGNFGDVLAGFYAKRLGLPIAKLVVATNENDILERFWKSGRYEKKDSKKEGKVNGHAQVPETAIVEGSSDGSQQQQSGSGSSDGGVKATLAPAMDILVSSNFERLLWYLAYDVQVVPSNIESSEPPAPEIGGAGDAGDVMDRVRRAQETVKGWMDELKRTGGVDLESVVVRAREDFTAERVSDEQTVEQIRHYYSGHGSSAPYVVDPHTAIGLAATERVIADSPVHQIFITLSTAHPAKFDEAVQRALPQEQFSSFDFRKDVMPEEFKAMEDLALRVTRVKDERGVREFIEKLAEKEVPVLAPSEGVGIGSV